MAKEYNAGSIEVLSGLDPVRRRPGMYTDTTRPNHLVQEVLDNSVDEALAGYARLIEVTLNKDGSVEVTDDGRGMPVDTHPEEKVSGVELILTRLHAGGKFSSENYKFSGGLHGVGVSVVNALSLELEVLVKRNGNVYRMTFANGDKTSELKAIDKCGMRNTGTTVRFTPDPKYFDSATISVPGLSSNADTTRKGMFSRIARPTERTCSTFAPTPASSSISSKVTSLSLRALGTMRGSVV